MNCACCGRQLPEGKVYFHPDCWAKVPAKERVELYQMHARKLNTDSKVAKIVRILKERKAK